MEQPHQTRLTARLAQAVSEQMGFPVRVDEADGRIILSGTANSAAARASAEEHVATLMPGMPIQNNITVASSSQAEGEDAYTDQDRPGDTDAAASSISLEAAGDSELEPGLADQPLETNASNVADDSVADLDPPDEPDPSYFAPTDPVMDVDDQGSPEVLGGFSPTSMSSDAVDRSTLDQRPGDEAIADAVRRELREDALTTDLALDVQVEEGVVRLRGTAPSLQDVEGAEEVAGRVPGVMEVIDDIELAAQP